MILNLYNNLVPLGINSANQEYIVPKKYYRFLKHCYLGIVPYSQNIFHLLVTV